MTLKRFQKEQGFKRMWCMHWGKEGVDEAMMKVKQDILNQNVRSVYLKNKTGGRLRKTRPSNHPLEF